KLDDAACLTALVHRIGPDGFDPDNAHTRCEVDRGGQQARDQSAAADGCHDEVGLHVFQDLGHHGGLAGHDVRVVERVHVMAPGFGGPLSGQDVRVVPGGTMDD